MIRELISAVNPGVTYGQTFLLTLSEQQQWYIKAKRLMGRGDRSYCCSINNTFPARAGGAGGCAKQLQLIQEVHIAFREEDVGGSLA